MSTIESLVQSATASHSAFGRTLADDDLRSLTPAALAEAPDPRTSPTYSFIPTPRIIDALRCAGFVPVSAAQVASRRSTSLSAPHVIRFRRRYETVQLRDCIPEILFLNAHNGRVAVQFRIALFRPVCTNGLIVCDETLPAWKIPHRGDVVDAAVAAVIQQSEQFSAVGAWVERMEKTQLDELQRLDFASSALALRFPKDRHGGMRPAQLLEARRSEDVGNDLWRVYNVVQEHVIRGDVERRTASNRIVRTRPIKAVRRDVALNTALWSMATALAA